MPLEPLAPNQCLILAKAPLFAMSESNVLISNFYIRYVSDSGFAFEPPASSGSGTSLSWLFHVHGGNVWASNLTVQGDGSSEIGSVIIFPTAHAMFFSVPPLLILSAAACRIILRPSRRGPFGPAPGRAPPLRVQPAAAFASSS